MALPHACHVGRPAHRACEYMHFLAHRISSVGYSASRQLALHRITLSPLSFIFSSFHRPPRPFTTLVSLWVCCLPSAAYLHLPCLPAYLPTSAASPGTHRPTWGRGGATRSHHTGPPSTTLTRCRGICTAEAPWATLTTPRTTRTPTIPVGW